MKFYFTYDAIADRNFYLAGYHAAATGYVNGARLMFAAEEIGGPIYAVCFADETTEEDRIYGTVWEIDDELYDWTVHHFYEGHELVTGLSFIADDGEIIRCDTCYLPGGVFATPDEVVLWELQEYYQFYGLDESYIEKAIRDSEKEVYGQGNSA